MEAGGVQAQPGNLSPSNEEEFADLLEALKTTPLSEIKPHARYTWVQPIFADSFDHLEQYLVWAAAICQKHRDTWKAKLRSAGV